MDGKYINRGGRGAGHLGWAKASTIKGDLHVQNKSLTNPEGIGEGSPGL